MPQSDLLTTAEQVVAKLQATGLTLTTAESCTGGLIAATITAIPGASTVFHYGWVTYSAEAKMRQLHVAPELIDTHTVVSEPVVAAMATGALRQAAADISIAVSGNAGPSSAPGEPPVGTVCLALMRKGAPRPIHTETLYRADLARNDFRLWVTQKALSLVLNAINL